MTEINQAMAEKALNYLASSDESFARTKSKLQAMENLLKRVEALEFQAAEGSAEARKMAARASESYLAQVNEIQKLAEEVFIYANKRDRARITIEMWRSINAARRQGQI